MKKHLLKIVCILSITLFIAACSVDNDTGVFSNGTSSESLYIIAAPSLDCLLVKHPKKEIRNTSVGDIIRFDGFYGQSMMRFVLVEKRSPFLFENEDNSYSITVEGDRLLIPYEKAIRSMVEFKKGNSAIILKPVYEGNLLKVVTDKIPYYDLSTSSFESVNVKGNLRKGKEFVVDSIIIFGDKREVMYHVNDLELNSNDVKCILERDLLSGSTIVNDSEYNIWDQPEIGQQFYVVSDIIQSGYKRKLVKGSVVKIIEQKEWGSGDGDIFIKVLEFPQTGNRRDIGNTAIGDKISVKCYDFESKMISKH